MAESHKPGAPQHLEQAIISEREKPALDETTFQQLLEAARLEIWEHVTFWDDVYFTVRGVQHKLAS